MPQLIIQATTLTLLTNSSNDYSGFVITIFSMIFTLMSILLSGFEYLFSSRFVGLGANIIVSFGIQSNDIVNMPHKKYLSKMVFQRRELIATMAKLLNVRQEQVERLKPKKLSHGAMYIFTIAVDETKYQDIEKKIKESVKNGELAQEFENIYHISVNAIHDVVVERLQQIYTGKMTSIDSNVSMLTDHKDSARTSVDTNVYEASTVVHHRSTIASISLHSPTQSDGEQADIFHD